MLGALLGRTNNVSFQSSLVQNCVSKTILIYKKVGLLPVSADTSLKDGSIFGRGTMAYGSAMTPTRKQENGIEHSKPCENPWVDPDLQTSTCVVLWQVLTFVADGCWREENENLSSKKQSS